MPNLSTSTTSASADDAARILIRLRPLLRAQVSTPRKWLGVSSCGAMMSRASGILSRIFNHAGKRCGSSEAQVDPATSVGLGDRSEVTLGGDVFWARAQTWS